MVSVITLCGRFAKNLVRSGPDATLEPPTRVRGRSVESGSLCNRHSWLRASPGSESLHALSLGSLEFYSCSSLAKFTVMVEPVESELTILADLNEVAVGIAHVAAPFPAVIV
jgi:hypothetical protein